MLNAKTALRPVVFGFLIVFASVLSIGVWVKYETENQIKNWATSHMKAIVSHRAELLESVAKTQETSVTSLASLVRSFSHNDKKVFSNNSKISYIFDEHISVFSKAFNFYDVLAIDPDGMVVKTLKHESDEHASLFSASFSDTKLLSIYKQALKQDGVFRSGFFYYHPSKKFASFIASRVVIEGIVAGVIVAQINPSVFYDITTDRNGLGQSGEVVTAVKNDEKSITLMTPTRLDETKVYQTLARPADAPISKAVRGQVGDGLGVDRRGKDIVVSWQYIPTLGWGIVAKMDQDELLSGWRNSTFVMDILFCFTVLLMGLLLYLVYKKIASPVKVLIRGANSLADGNYDTRITISGEDEFFHLAETFNRMADKISQDRQTLLSKKSQLEMQRDEIDRLNKKLTKTIDQKSDQIARYLDLIDANVITSSTDKYGVITHISDAFCKISGFSKDELIGATHRILRHPDTPPSFYIHMWDCIKASGCWSGEVKNLNRNRTVYWVKITIAPDYDKDILVGYTAIIEDITDRKKLEEIAITDSLTSLYNRRFFNSVVLEEINRAKRNEINIGLMVIDIDHFKAYNDTRGHLEGDIILKKVATALQNEAKRAGDYVFRIGGEEFAILFSGLDFDDSKAFAERIRRCVELLEIEHNYNDSINIMTISIGLAVVEPASAVAADELYGVADKKLYEAKRNGRNKTESQLV